VDSVVTEFRKYLQDRLREAGDGEDTLPVLGSNRRTPRPWQLSEWALSKLEAVKGQDRVLVRTH